MYGDGEEALHLGAVVAEEGAAVHEPELREEARPEGRLPPRAQHLGARGSGGEGIGEIQGQSWRQGAGGGGGGSVGRQGKRSGPGGLSGCGNRGGAGPLSTRQPGELE